MPPKSLKQISLSEFDKHTSEESCWMLYQGEIVDVSNYMAEHPGGVDAILGPVASKEQDCTAAFDAIGHSESARAKLRSLVIGTLNADDRKVVEARTKASSSGAATIIVLVIIIAVALYFVLM